MHSAIGGGGHLDEKELAHESHLIQHSEQPALSQFSRENIDVFNPGRPRYNPEP